MAKNRIFILYPPVSKHERYSSDIGHAGGNQIPLGIYYLASFLREHNFEVKVVDAEAQRLSSDDIVDAIEKFSPDIVGVSSTTMAFHRAVEITREMRQRLRRLFIVLGGAHVSANPKEAMNTGLFNAGVIGEGEQSFLELSQALLMGQPLAEIQGIIYRDESSGEYIVTTPRPLIANLDTLPFPAFDLIDDLSLYYPPPSNYKTLPVINMITSRGCPGKCSFCDKNIFGNTCRQRSAENVAEEIAMLSKKYKIREIAFVDDTFLLNKKRVYQLFEILNTMNLHFDWTCMSRINDVDYDFLKFLKEQGCWHISFGIESGNQEILRRIRKYVSLQKTEELIRDCKRLGIKTKGFFIIGHPGETIETINQTIQLACRLKLDDIVVTLNTPIPGSQQYDECSIYGSLNTTDWSQYNYWRPVFVPSGLTHDLLLAKHREIYRKFYMRPQKMWRYFLSFFAPGGFRRFYTIVKASRFLFGKTK
ncbi:MAG TPA: radical SAM protein [Bacteroidales bacterium]|nr:radical SAM protein [Bacteroidales bacterium]